MTNFLSKEFLLFFYSALIIQTAVENRTELEVVRDTTTKKEEKKNIFNKNSKKKLESNAPLADVNLHTNEKLFQHKSDYHFLKILNILYFFVCHSNSSARVTLTIKLQNTKFFSITKKCSLFCLFMLFVFHHHNENET